MSAFIRLDKQDAFVVPYTAHKTFSLISTRNSGSGGLEFYYGTRDRSTLFSRQEGTAHYEYTRLVYDSVSHLYYSNFTASIETGSYDNYNQSSLYFSRSLSETDGAHVFVFGLAKERFGEAINPGTFSFYSGSTFEITDDSEGNLILKNSTSISQFISSSVTSSTVVDIQTENLNPDIGSSTLDQLTTDPSTYYGTQYVLTGITYNGSDITSPFVLDGVTRVNTVPSAYVSTYLSYISNTVLKSSSTAKVQFDTGVVVDGDITFTWESSSIQATAVTTVLAQSESFAAGERIGNIFYPHGMAVVTNSNLAAHLWYSEQYSSSFAWENSHTLYQHEYRCKIRESSLNYSQNPSIKSGSDGSVYDFATGSYFQPYVTTIGLYNDANDLVAVAKLAQPVPKSRYTDMTFVVKFDS